MIHGGIDGHSRLVTFLRVSNNTRAESMLNAFGKGVKEYGLPLKVRMDRGGENVSVTEYMLDHPNRGEGCVIVGHSIHNQRIERLWKDLFNGCVSFFYYFFYFLED